LTFRADRIWKGPVSRDIVVYQLGVGFVGHHVLRQGEKYLMFANVLPANDRRLAGVSPDELIALHPSVVWLAAMATQADSRTR
jgi:hypothetical protein